MEYVISQSMGMSGNLIHDMIVYSYDRQPTLVVDIYTTTETSPERASAIRQNLLERDPLLHKSFVLIACHTAVFLWEQGAPPDAIPEVAPVQDILREYGGMYADREQSPMLECLTIIFYVWLSGLIDGFREPEQTCEADQLLVRTGIYHQIRRGDIVREARI